MARDPKPSTPEIFSRVETLGDALLAVFEEAAARDEAPLATVQRKVEETLAAARSAARG